MRTNLNRRRLLQGGLASAALLPLFGGVARAAPGAGKLLVILARGAWDVTYSLDPKDPATGSVADLIDGPWYNPSLGASEEDRIDPNETIRTFSGIPVAANPVLRPSVGRFFNGFGDRSVVINGISMGSIVHDACRLRILTGTRVETSPDLAAIVGSVRGAGTTVGYTDFAGQGFLGSLAASSLRVGNGGQLKALLDPASPLPAPAGGSRTSFVPQGSEVAAVQAYLQARAERLRGGLGDRAADIAQLQNLVESRQRAENLLADGPSLTSSLVLGETLSVADQFAFATEMFRLGHCTTALLDSGLAWDTHEDNHDQHELQESFFGGLFAIANVLESEGMLEDTLVAVVSEFTRTPKLNDEDGKDHWPVASMLLFGGGLSGGRVLGGTDDGLGALGTDLTTGAVDELAEPLGYANVAAGILAAMGVDPEEFLPGVEVFDALLA